MTLQETKEIQFSTAVKIYKLVEELGIEAAYQLKHKDFPYGLIVNLHNLVSRKVHRDTINGNDLKYLEVKPYKY